MLCVVDLSGANLQGADLKATIIRGANLEGATGATQEQLNAALGDEHTVLPEGLTRPAFWAERV